MMDLAWELAWLVRSMRASDTSRSAAFKLDLIHRLEGSSERDSGGLPAPGSADEARRKVE